METSENIISKIVNKKPIKPNDVVVAPVNKDGNCFYRALSLFFTNSEGNHKIIRDIIYNVAIINKEFIKPFFLTGLEDDILADHKLENYIERIKNDGLYAGIIEISLATIIFNYTIIIYSVEEELIEKKDIKEPSDIKTNKVNQKKKNL